MGYHVVEPQGTFYIFPRTLIPDDIAFCEKAKEDDLLLVAADGFGCPGWVRISYCVDGEMIRRSFGAFQKLYDRYK